ncbi:MAG: MFS transporter, partial [Mesorhizobium sp.]
MLRVPPYQPRAYLPGKFHLSRRRTMTDIADTAAVPASRSTTGALASLSLAMLLSSLSTSIANVALPTLSIVFAASFPAVQWVVLAYLLAITALIVSVGRLGDLVGRRLLLVAGLGLFSAASLAAALAPTLPLLVAARAAQGLGAAVMMA